MENRDAESFSDFIDIGPAAGPVHERRSSAVDELVVHLDTFFREAGFKKPQHCCHAVLAPAVADERQVVAHQIQALQIERAGDRGADGVVFDYIAVTHV